MIGNPLAILGPGEEAVKVLLGLQLCLSLILIILIVVVLHRLNALAERPDVPRATQELPHGRPSTERADIVKGRLLVLRAAKTNWEYPIYKGANILGRSNEKPADIDLMALEGAPDRIWSSFQHAAIHADDNTLWIEDLNSANGTYVNRKRVVPGTKQTLEPNDIIQIGEIQFKVLIP